MHELPTRFLRTPDEPEHGGMVRGLSHITFVVRDLDRTEQLFVRLLDARRVYDSGEHTFSIAAERFLLAGGEPDSPGSIWIAIMLGDPLPRRTYDHVAFSIDEGDYDRCLREVGALGLEVRPGRERVEGEGRSIYFYDYDDHLIELHTGSLQQRLARYGSGR